MVGANFDRQCVMWQSVVLGRFNCVMLIEDNLTYTLTLASLRAHWSIFLDFLRYGISNERVSSGGGVAETGPDAETWRSQVLLINCP